jgi:hypothetical protein
MFNKKILIEHKILRVVLVEGWGMSVNGPFCSDLFNPFKRFFLLWILIVTITRLDVKI